jgi:lycopene beta-cyclase
MLSPQLVSARTSPHHRLMSDFDYILVGGGLQNGLITLALRAYQPGARIALIERDGALGGNHTWCFHGSHVDAGARTWLEPLVVNRWPGYRILFPEGEHRLEECYSRISSKRLHAVVSEAIEGHGESTLLLGTAVADVGADWVHLGSGGTVRAMAVIDGRGAVPLQPNAPSGYQKFLGLEVELEAPHGLDVPIIMDATVEQVDGYRFIYVLPLDDRTVLIEDTYFHDSPVLSAKDARQRIHAYAATRGWSISTMRREESGVLPMPWAEAHRPDRSGALAAGYRGGWFHPGTGYSLPVAVRLATFVAKRPPDALFGPDLDAFQRQHRAQARFARFLNRLMFRWYPPGARRAIFERFYRLPQDTIERFYALRLRPIDRLRLLSGRPPRGLSVRHRLAAGVGR